MQRTSIKQASVAELMHLILWMIFYWLNHLASSAVDMQGGEGELLFILNGFCGFGVPLTMRVEGKNLVRTGEGEAEPAPVKVL